MQQEPPNRGNQKGISDMAPNDARNVENDERNPGLTPLDNPGNINRAGKKHEPDSTTGRLPERAERKPQRHDKKSRQPRGR
jgi:hypothetical protein